MSKEKKFEKINKYIDNLEFTVKVKDKIRQWVQSIYNNQKRVVSPQEIELVIQNAYAYNKDEPYSLLFTVLDDAISRGVYSSIFMNWKLPIKKCVWN